MPKYNKQTVQSRTKKKRLNNQKQYKKNFGTVQGRKLRQKLRKKNKHISKLLKTNLGLKGDITHLKSRANYLKTREESHLLRIEESCK